MLPLRILWPRPTCAGSLFIPGEASGAWRPSRGLGSLGQLVGMRTGEAVPTNTSTSCWEQRALAQASC